MLWINLILVAVLIICLITDLKSRKIYNKVLFPTLILAFVANFILSGVAGLGISFLGLFLGLGILLIPFLLGGMGAGDVKLLAVIGALKGASFVLTTAIYMALVGGGIAIVIILLNKGQSKKLLYYFIGKKHGLDVPFEKNVLSSKFPYGVAIVAGALVTLFNNEAIIFW